MASLDLAVACSRYMIAARFAFKSGCTSSIWAWPSAVLAAQPPVLLSRNGSGRACRGTGRTLVGRLPPRVGPVPTPWEGAHPAVGGMPLTEARSSIGWLPWLPASPSARDPSWDAAHRNCLHCQGVREGPVALAGSASESLPALVGACPHLWEAAQCAACDCGLFQCDQWRWSCAYCDGPQGRGAQWDGAPQRWQPSHCAACLWQGSHPQVSGWQPSPCEPSSLGSRPLRPLPSCKARHCEPSLLRGGVVGICPVGGCVVRVLELKA